MEEAAPSYTGKALEMPVQSTRGCCGHLPLHGATATTPCPEPDAESQCVAWVIGTVSEAITGPSILAARAWPVQAIQACRCQQPSLPSLFPALLGALQDSGDLMLHLHPVAFLRCLGKLEEMEPLWLVALGSPPLPHCVWTLATKEPGAQHSPISLCTLPI